MSRVAKKPIKLPSGVEVKIAGQSIEIKGAKGTHSHTFSELVSVNADKDDDGGTVLSFQPKNESIESRALAGTTRANVNNSVIGVSEGFEKKLELRGVGYRAQVQGQKINITAGFSHPVVHELPEGMTAESPSPTEILIKGADLQKVGQEAAKIRAIRPPECYKGKGIRYAGEHISLKETKKK